MVKANVLKSVVIITRRSESCWLRLSLAKMAEFLFSFANYDAFFEKEEQLFLISF